MLEARIGAHDPQDELTTLAVDGETLLVPGRIGEDGSTCRVRIAANDVSLAATRPSPTSILNIVPVRVREVQPIYDARAGLFSSTPIAVQYRQCFVPIATKRLRQDAPCPVVQLSAWNQAAIKSLLRGTLQMAASRRSSD